MVTDVTIAGNNADVHGGAICNFGFATIFGSTLSTNDAIGGDGGGILNDGGNLNITNSTITTNGAQNSGGGISNSGTANLTNVTVVSNSANTSGGNLYNSTGFTLTVRNTIIANSVTTTNCNGVITSASGNLSSDLSCSLPGSDLSNVDPLLGGLAGNGGPTLTHALLPGSPAIDAGNGGVLPTTDQRGYVRVWDGNGDGTAIVDIGAYEYGAPPYTTPSSIPTMNEWGMIIFMVLAGIGSFYYLRRQKTVKS